MLKNKTKKKSLGKNPLEKCSKIKPGENPLKNSVKFLENKTNKKSLGKSLEKSSKIKPAKNPLENPTKKSSKIFQNSKKKIP